MGLGDYWGGELAVEPLELLEGNQLGVHAHGHHQIHDIRYRPLEFNGWKQRHWTLPFKGERYSIVWFTPRGCENWQKKSDDLLNGIHGIVSDNGIQGGERKEEKEKEEDSASSGEAVTTAATIADVQIATNNTNDGTTKIKTKAIMNTITTSPASNPIIATGTHDCTPKTRDEWNGIERSSYLLLIPIVIAAVARLRL